VAGQAHEFRTHASDNTSNSFDRLASSLKLLDLPNVVVLTTVAVLAAVGGAHALTRRRSAASIAEPASSPKLYESVGPALD
jgi:hypothetical protein